MDHLQFILDYNFFPAQLDKYETLLVPVYPFWLILDHIRNILNHLRLNFGPLLVHPYNFRSFYGQVFVCFFDYPDHF